MRHFDQRLAGRDENRSALATERGQLRKLGIGTICSEQGDGDAEQKNEPGGLRGTPARLAIALAVLACASPTPPPEPAPTPAEPPAAAIRAPEPPVAQSCERIERVEIRKRAHRLKAHCESGMVFETAVALGRGEPGRKQSLGDKRTPEGTYHLVAPLASSGYHGFLALDYPSVDDAARALAERRISRADHRRIVEAHRRGRMPPADTPLGGDIGIHGEGPRWQGVSARVDWTLGCLAVSDAALDFLAERLELGTPFVILP